jgi:hypothetical protein
MKARQVSLTASRNAAIAIAAVTALWTSPAAWGEGGTIRFVGAIVAPTFGIAQASAGVATSAAMSTQQTVDPVTGVTTVHFTNTANAMLRADVSTLDADAGRTHSQPLRYTTTFVDGAGHRLERDASGSYRVGASGGVMTLAPASTGRDAEPALVTVLTDYR